MPATKPRCSIPDCGKPVRARGWCGSHYERWRRHGDPRAGCFRPESCTVEGCDRPHVAKGLCNVHYNRKWKTGDVHADVPVVTKAPAGSGCIDTDGYRKIYIDGKPYREHKVVMEQHLGRKLFPDETVHHHNGVRHQNNIENLELRVGAHPQGLSVVEAIAWAETILERYQLEDFT